MISLNSEQARAAIYSIQPSNFPPETIERAQNALWYVHRKLGPTLKTAPPSEEQTAMFLGVADWRRLEGVLHELVQNAMRGSNRQTIGSYGQYIAIAFERIYDEPLTERGAA